MYDREHNITFIHWNVYALTELLLLFSEHASSFIPVCRRDFSKNTSQIFIKFGTDVHC